MFWKDVSLERYILVGAPFYRSFCIPGHEKTVVNNFLSAIHREIIGGTVVK